MIEFYSFCRQLSVGPEALVSLLVGGAISQSVDPGADMSERMAVTSLLCLMVGIITFVLGILRLGFLDSVLSRALLRGFITAVACVILIEQLPELLGMQLPDLSTPGHDETHEPSPFTKLLLVIEHLDRVNWVTFAISIASVVFLFGFGKLKHAIVRFTMRRPKPPSDSTPADHEPLLDTNRTREVDQESLSPKSIRSNATLASSASIPWYVHALIFLPDILVVVVTTILVSEFCDLHDRYQVTILGPAAMQTGFRLPTIPKVTSARFRSLITPAILMAVLGFVESIVGAKNYGSKYR
jgi:MFS superfamily sulfate permease-like transporter